MRCFTWAAVGAVLLAVSPAAVATAATGAPSCSMGDMSASDGYGMAPSTSQAGVPVIASSTLRNNTAALLSNANVLVDVIPPPGYQSGAAPRLAWRYDGGGWNWFGVSWSAPAGSGASWVSPNLYFGSLAPGSTHTLQIEAVFSAGSASGDYQYSLAFSADPCNMNALAMTELFAAYLPSSGHSGGGGGGGGGSAPSTPAQPAPHQSSQAPQPAAAASTGAPTPSPSLVPSTSAAASSSPSPIPVSPSPARTPQAVELASATRRSGNVPLALTFSALAVVGAAGLAVSRFAKRPR